MSRWSRPISLPFRRRICAPWADVLLHWPWAAGPGVFHSLFEGGYVHLGLAHWCISHGPLVPTYIRPFQGRGTSRQAGGGLAASGCVSIRRAAAQAAAPLFPRTFLSPDSFHQFLYLFLPVRSGGAAALGALRTASPSASKQFIGFGAAGPAVPFRPFA